jgi:hypothetical protein
MSERTFLIQRYCTGNWPEMRGERPFFATGPQFSNWAYGLERYNEWRILPTLPQQLETEFVDDRTEAAAALLDMGIVQALWVEHTEVPAEDWMTQSIIALADEIPKAGPLGEAVVDYLSGLSAPGHFRAYVAEDQIDLVPMPCPGS